jgi:hypothetical protein
MNGIKTMSFFFYNQNHGIMKLNNCFYLLTFYATEIDINADVKLINARAYLTRAKALERMADAQRTLKDVLPGNVLTNDFFFRVTNSETGQLLIKQNPGVNIVLDWE